jgi:hypothetical protein
VSFTDFVQLQNDCAHALLGDPWLQEVNIITRERLLDPNSLQRLPDQTLAAEVLVYLTPRNKMGRAGAGIIIEKPQFQVSKPNLPGPCGDLILEFLILEDRLANEAPTTGTLKPADQIAQRILEVMHGWRLGSQGAFYADANTLQPARDWEPLTGYRVRLRSQLSRGQTDRVAVPTLANNAHTITLTTVTAEAEIRYTTDGGFPGPSNSAALIYTTPFVVDSGTTVRWAAYLADSLGSNVGSQTIT